MVTFDGVQPASTFASAVEMVEQTSSRSRPAKPRPEAKHPAWLVPRSSRQTGLPVDPAEQGSEDERNQTSSNGKVDQGKEAEVQKPVDDAEGSRIRSELARDLVQRVNQLEQLFGDVALAAHIGLLKRDLSRCHDALKGHPGESNFLSIVTLVESAMAQLKWKQYTQTQLESIRQALDIGYRKVRVRFEDYEIACSLLADKDVDTTPRIDLDSLKLEDLTDDEEG